MTSIQLLPPPNGRIKCFGLGRCDRDQVLYGIFLVLSLVNAIGPTSADGGEERKGEERRGEERVFHLSTDRLFRAVEYLL